MRILVLNVGSSSVKASILDPDTGQRAATTRLERVDDPEAAVAEAVAGIAHAGVDAVVHRVVHGGSAFDRPVQLDEASLAALEGLVDLAPLHLPGNLAGIRAARQALPEVPHVAVFDTAFHSTLPPRAWRYALPRELADRHGVRRYGFHGASHAWVARQAAAHLGRPLNQLRLITCHLGGGCSVAAIEYGRSVETSMGLTPVEGLVMGTRAGDVDAGALLHLARREGLDADALDALLNDQSGLAGLSGRGSDMRDILQGAADGDEACRESVAVFCHRVRKYIGAYAAVLGGADAIVFTGGIGENSAEIRHRATQRLTFLGASLDEDANRDASVDPLSAPVAEFGNPAAPCRLLVVATDEARQMAADASTLLSHADAVTDVGPIPVAISARHVHLDQAAADALFGPGATLTPRKGLSQPGQFAAEQRVTLVGPRGRIEGVSVVGPLRSRTQVEISRTDEFALGIDAPIRVSGDIDGTPGLVLEGPHGRYVLQEGVIQSQRHIHMTTADAERFGVSHKDVVSVAIDSDGRDLVFGDVVVRVKDSYRLEMHVDTDEGNAAELIRGAVGEVLCATPATAHVTRLVRS